jgi:predicted nucleic acid-binding Zn ribbon protein
VPETVHCSVCGKAIRGDNFADIMAKLRRHRQKAHPSLFRKSIRKGVATRKRNKGKRK